MEFRKPNLFIVGAPKAGTTFLYEKLKNHPDLYFPKIKELNHFSYREIRDFLYYKDFKVEGLQKYLSFYENATSQKYLTDSSVSYFAFENVPQKIAAFNKNAKIVIILRDPVERALSHYSMDNRMGHAEHPILVYLEEKERFSAHYFQYIENSFYSKNIGRYLDTFGSSNVCILKLENLDRNFSRLFDFLQIEDLSSAIDTNHKVNTGNEARNVFARYFLKNRNITGKIKLLLPGSIINFLKSYFYRSSVPINFSEKEKKIIAKILQNELEYYQQLA